MTEDVNDPFYGMGVTLEQVQAAADSRKVSVRNGGVCVCGHAAKAHTEHAEEGAADGKHDAYRAADMNICIPSKAPCECKKYSQVLTAQDLRKFRHSTKGPAQQHALFQGVLASAQASKTVLWDPEVCCVFCKRLRTEPGVGLVPVAYDGVVESYTTTAHNVMICVDCRASLKRGERPGAS